ncbi:MAG: hypothetical protein K2M78_11430 [Lachnospiraceae bacterium]|nr:hypothetical protein [Lachnospiraceae bacterium]
MNLIELVELVREKKVKANVGLRQYVDVEDISDRRICIDGKWLNMPSVWGICWKDGEWVYFETDEERGYISGIKAYATEEEACEGTYRYLVNRIGAEQDGYTDKDFAIRYVQNEFGYSKEEAKAAVKEIMKQKDIFEEFCNYMVHDEYCNDEGETVEAAGYGAERLVEKEGFTSVAAYRFLVQLRENKDEAEKALRNGTVRKE